MVPVHALDRFYLLLTFLVTVGWQLSGFAIAYTLKVDKITDFTGGSNFFVLALLSLLIGNTFYARNIVASALVMVWAVRIASFLLFRVIKTGRDARFDNIRSHIFKFLGFWIGQILWVWTVSLPVVILNSPAVSDKRIGGDNPKFGTGRDIAGIIIWALGFSVEAVADQQKYYYKSRNKIPKGLPTNRGLWAWSRHPPYFGEMLCWWGIWMICISPATNGSLPTSSKSALYGSVVSPLLTFIILMFGSGLPTAEKPTAKRFFLLSNGRDTQYASAWKHYQEYLQNTSILIPIPPSIYGPLPRIIKRTILMDFPMYSFSEEKDGEVALHEAQEDE
ncbi:hypothetical protein AGABI1DRAFT_70541 [Agaricus bisporus var. burnettii JB137-S8]|uniref:Uncharacterized protein n=1 Tax=Agaricus bisporus var. burnettii (strain JB137-S8 / ATCC MYA-4627 / FGSC 10392) TaxID=597362 RepID=K5XFF5_AGABU|nr:hypothetical protein AGABI2DRAFT_206289 [Agaricus bisporus var. bisporus H97]XP_007327301.1 uncharacterized protein AGABI1DRAFT_70541 [Agaricus bisporus var. burnettii JB137-S8]EKM81967.1 hypothetical protein AGABI1DRAFT_70541 [Agaricus bisporus var. burnettii JB137-S8]EKV46772.1 hypothetical protein AGABI2DRAFT_206289 [Agaricus bisporus var. bisporus H97]